MHANKQLVNSENWTLNYSVGKTNNMFPFPTKTRGELAHRLTLVSPRFFFSSILLLDRIWCQCECRL